MNERERRRDAGEKKEGRNRGREGERKNTVSTKMVS